MPKDTAPDRQKDLDAAIAAGTFATIDFQRGPGGMISAQWLGDETLPVLVSKQMEDELAKLPWPLTKVADRDETTAIYARP